MNRGKYMFDEKYSHDLSLFNSLHLITLGALMTILVLYIVFKKYFKDPKREMIFRYLLASLMVLAEGGFHIWSLTNGGYGWDMIPFTGFCATTNLLTVIALYTDNRKIASVSIYYAIVGSFFALLFVDITYGPPHFRFFSFFIVHFGFLLANVHFYIQDKLYVNRKYLTITAVAMSSQSILLIILNLLFQKNWFYFVESPVKDVSDFFGQPWYGILWFVTIVLMVFGIYGLLKTLRKPVLEKTHTNE